MTTVRRTRTAWMALLGVVALLALAGCGGSDSSSDESDAPVAGETSTTEQPPPAPPTKAEYIAAADKVCKQGNVEGARLVGDLNDTLAALSSATTPEAQKSTASAAANLLGKIAELRDEVSSDLEALETPEAGPADKYLASRERSTEATRDQVKAFQAYGNAPSPETSAAAAAAAEKSQELTDESRKLAEQYGFKICGQPAK